MIVLSKQGCPLEKYWPYDLAKWTAEPPASVDAKAAEYRVAMYFRCPTLSSIKHSISQGFPVVGGFVVPENMFTEECAKTGVVKVPSLKEGWEGGHAVLFTGYDNATGLLEFQNSWSEAWGDKGYGYLPYEYVTKGWADDFWTIRRAV
jgi:C1A family cysteine protease